MADPRDDRVCAAYRDMPGDGPSPALDAAIQAAARRAVGSRPGGARRWQVPVSIAAVLALAIGISLNVDREKPMVVDGTPVSSGSAEYPVAQAAPETEEPAAPASPPAVSASSPARASPPAPASHPTPASPPASASHPTPASPPATASMRAAPAAVAPLSVPIAPLPAAVAPPPAQAPAALAVPPVAAGAAASADNARAAPQVAKRAKSETARDSVTAEKPQAEAMQTPERRLERIAELRAQGRHDDADRALAEFRRAYPAYRISDDWLRKVERR
ncbi:MAG: hypothetical protein IPP91_14005 [Betaproteobacteria bacterium]|nr:hypothetical protein [Betaproteobacteria bacterium]